MSANLDLVRSIYAGLERGDFSSVEWAHPEIEFVIAGGPSPGTWTGVPSMVKAMRDFVTAWRDYRVRPKEYRELGYRHVLVLSELGGSGRTSGISLAQMRSEGSTLFEIRCEKVVRLVLYPDRDRALADLGLEK